MAISMNSRITGVLPNNERSNMTAHIALMAIDGLLILLIMEIMLLYSDRRGRQGR